MKSPVSEAAPRAPACEATSQDEVLPADAGSSALPEGDGGPVEIANRSFRLIEVIGRGAFGIVWRAREAGLSEDLAIKVVSAKDTAGFVAAAFEAELMQILQATCSQSTRHMPRYIAHNASKLNSQEGGGTVHLAMSYVSGGPLDKWLYGISDEAHKTADIADLVKGRMPGSQQGSHTFERACGVAQELLQQLSTVFIAFQPLAFHRDVSSHNVLVDVDPASPSAPGGRLDFALIDFGLAVRSGSWSQEWRSSNLAGDPRYWTPATWMAFAFGFKYLNTHPNPGFQKQYLTRIDHFAVGILALETLFVLWQPEEALQQTNPTLWQVRAAWEEYWTQTFRMFQMFHAKGAQEVRQLITHSQDEGLVSLVERLRQLRHTMRTAAEQQVNAGCACLLHLLADLVSENGTACWGDVPAALVKPRIPAATAVSASSDQSAVTARLVSPKAPLQSPIGARRFSHGRFRSTDGAITVMQDFTRPDPVGAEQYGAVIARSPTSMCRDQLSRSLSHMRRPSGHF